MTLSARGALIVFVRGLPAAVDSRPDGPGPAVSIPQRRGRQRPVSRHAGRRILNDGQTASAGEKDCSAAWISLSAASCTEVGPAKVQSAHRVFRVRTLPWGTVAEDREENNVLSQACKRIYRKIRRMNICGPGVAVFKYLRRMSDEGPLLVTSRRSETYLKHYYFYLLSRGCVKKTIKITYDTS